MIRKIGLFFLSLWLLFIIVIIITIQVPLYFGSDWEFIGFGPLLSMNIIPVLCVLSLLIGLFSYLDFRFLIKGAPDLSFKVIEIENVDYEHLTFLTTYIIPLVCFNFASVRYQVAFGLILVVIAIIYVRTDLFYANPTLAILRFRIYRVNGEFRNGSIKKNRILITREEIALDDRVKYIKLDDRIYYAYKV